MKKVYRLLIIIFFVILLLTIWMVTGFYRMLEGARQEALQLENALIDMSDVKDGTYKGNSQLGVVVVEVEVLVRDGTIKDIQILEHQNGLGSGANVIVDEMMLQNTYNVDAVSGATISSQVIINAVNDALQKGL